MSFFSFFRKNHYWDYTKAVPAWDDNRVSLYEFIRNEILNSEDNCLEEHIDLPDENIFFQKHQIKWVAGAADGGYLLHGGGPGNLRRVAEQVFLKIQNITLKRKISNIDLKDMYELFLTHDPMSLVVSLEEVIANNKDKINFPKLFQMAYWLTRNSPDRNPVKVGLSLLGMAQNKYFRDIFMQFALHEEFTLFAALALSETSDMDVESDLWYLAQRVNGWGKIHLVRILSGSKNKEIKQWLLIEGYKNTIMYEYLAYICADKGDLLNALNTSTPEENLIISAGEILEALIKGGPAKDISYYKDGAEAVKVYLNLIGNRELSLEQLRIVNNIYKFATDNGYRWEEIVGWSEEVRKEIATEANMILTNPRWKNTM